MFIAGLLAGAGVGWYATRRLAVEFRALSADALRANRAEFLEQAREDLVKPLRESLDKVDTRILEMERARAGAYGALGEQLKSLGAAQATLQAETARLATALRSTSYAGSWGELQLRRVVEMADMLPYVDFSEQETSGSLRADMVIRLPGGGRIVVDAKAPLESYRLAGDAPEGPARAALLAEHASKVRGHIDALGAKSYWQQFQPAPEFVVLFLPGDHFLGAALMADPLLLDRAHAKQVLLATPTTLIALLKASALGWRQEALSRNAEEISALGRQLYDRVAGFADSLAKVGAALETAVKGYNAAVGSFEQTLLPGARRFAELGARGMKELNGPEGVDTGVRIVAKRS